MARRKTHEEFILQLHNINPNIRVLGKYITAIEPVLCECTVCGYQWPGIPNNLLRGEGCGQCAGHLKKTTASFVEEMKRINPSIQIVGEYVDSKTHIACKCLVCGHEWSPIPSSLLKGHGCKLCAEKVNSKKRKLTTEQFLERLRIRNPGVQILENYIDFKTPIRCRCVCGNDSWLVKPGNLLKGSLCKECAGQRSAKKQKGHSRPNKHKKTHEEFIKECFEKNPTILIIGDYSGADNMLEVQCKRCGHIWNPRAQVLLKGSGCPKCHRKMQTSFAEQAIFFYVKKQYPNSVNGYKNGFGQSELDIFIPELQIGIEYDGRKWHKNKENIEMRKYSICNDRGITLIRVRERKVRDVAQICDYIIYSEYGDRKNYISLDRCIRELLRLLNISADVDCNRDRIKIQEQYFKRIEEQSLGTLFPELAKEWHQPSNGNITPFMVKPKSNVAYYWACPDCGEIYPAPPANRIAGSGCASCAGVKKLTHEEFEHRVLEKHPNLILLGKYHNSTEQIKCQCTTCGQIWDATPQSITNGKGCKKCWNKAMADQKRKTQEVFLEQVKQRHPRITVLGKYENSHSEILCRCDVCGNEWSPVAQSLIAGYGCSNCAGTKSRKVVCIETGEVYRSIRQAEINTGISHSTISNCCNGKGKTAGGYHWKFIEE
jgi:predicted  nucleic acid-binding Zn-ribbon protein